MQDRSEAEQDICRVGRSSSSCIAWVDFSTVWQEGIAVMNRAGHATTLPRQCDHVSGQTMVDYCLYCLYSVWLLHLDSGSITIFICFLIPNALLFFRVVVEMKLETCRVPSSGYEQLRGRGSSNQRRIYRHFLRFEA